MPVLSGSTVNVLPLSIRSANSLAEIRDALAAMPPRLEGRLGGWSGTSDEGSNLGGIGLAPRPSEPELTAAGGGLPDILHARYYYWGLPPSQLTRSVSDADTYRKLEALDLLIWETSPGRLSVVISSRNRQLTNRRDGALKSLEEVLKRADASIRLEPRNSAIALANPEIFLWLAVRAGATEERALTTSIMIDTLAGVSAADERNRPADLRHGIDFERPAFLTAVAESDVLGPLQFSFTVDGPDGRSSFELTLYADGGFAIHKSGIKYPEIMGDGPMMRRASYDLLFELVPRINEAFKSDEGAWKSRRVEVLKAAIASLRDRYENALADLTARLDAEV